MTPIHPDVSALHRQREDLKRQLAAIADMRPGSLVGRFRKCGKPNCHCGQQASPGHGPSWSLTRQVNGKTVTKIIPAGPAVERTREQLAEYQRFRWLTRELIEVSEGCCDAQLEAAALQGEVEKKGSTRAWPKKSARRSGKKSKL